MYVGRESTEDMEAVETAVPLGAHQIVVSAQPTPRLREANQECEHSGARLKVHADYASMECLTSVTIVSSLDDFSSFKVDSHQTHYSIY